MIFLSRRDGQGKGQPLREHLLGVAELTSAFLPGWLRDCGWWAGLWHDLGKYRPEWQAYLRGEGDRKTHAFQGAKLALSLAGNDRPAIALAILGHHAGLKRFEDLETRRFEGESETWELTLKNARNEIANFTPDGALPDINLPPLRREMAIRMLFSALVDADRLDAALFCNPQNQTKPSQKFRQFENNRLTFDSNFRKIKGGAIDEFRKIFLNCCIESHSNQKGLYRLTGPCGIGKTRSSYTFGAMHANFNAMKGIVYVGPFKSVIEQNAAVAREMFGSDAVLEHHSGYEPTSDYETYREDTERWNYPVICTSGVQFYESLFSNRPGACRKLHQIADRVILIDEAQTIPQSLAIPVLDVLSTLVEDWGCTVILMSATQPAFDKLELCHNATDIIPKNRRETFNAALKRHGTKLAIAPPLTWTDLGEKIGDRRQRSLVIFNTTKLARNGFNYFRENMGENWLHLSARMCPNHRKEVLSIIQENSDYHLISTQIVEAGIDIDFPDVYRQIAGLDSLFQSAGRCNRHQLRSPDSQLFTVFEIDEQYRVDPAYQKRINLTHKILAKFPDTFESDMDEALNLYFQKIYNQIQAGGEDIQKLRQNFDFPKVSENFNLIADINDSVLVPWKEGIDLIERFQHRERLTQNDWRHLQFYCASVPKRHEKTLNCSNGLKIWTGDYHPMTGCCDDR